MLSKVARGARKLALLFTILLSVGTCALGQISVVITRTPAAPIDSSTPLVIDDLFLSPVIVIADAEAYVDLSHSFVADLSVRLSGPTGITVTLTDQSGTSTPDIDATFASTGFPFDPALMTAGFETRIEAQGPGSLADFHGTTTGGEWSIEVEDVNPSSDDGILNLWRLEFQDLPAPAVGDECAGAIPILEGSLIDFDTTNATDSGIEPTCGSGPHRDLWFLYSAPEDGLVTASLCGSAYDTRVAVYAGQSGCPIDSSQELACNDDADCGSGLTTQSEVVFQVEAGQDYYLSVGGFGGDGGTGTLQLSFERPPVLPFDRGDANQDGNFDVADVVFLLDFYFPSGPIQPPSCEDAADLNDDGTLDIADAVRALDNLFPVAAPAAIPAPFGSCGSDPTDDPLGCFNSVCP